MTVCGAASHATVIMRYILAASLLISCVTLAGAQSAAQQPARPSVAVAEIEARPSDVATIDGVIAAFYEVISGPAGEPRQWARDRTLYVPGARFVSMGMREGRITKSVMDHQTYVDRTDPMFVRNGFFEREIHRVTKRVGNIAHVFSTYEYRSTPDGPAGGRGVNSIQMVWDGERWWIASATWDDERADSPIPPDLLP